MEEHGTNEIVERESSIIPETDEGLEVVQFNLGHDLQKRLDIYLHERLFTHSRSMLQKLIKSGTVLVNGRPAKASTLLRRGDCVELKVPPPAQREILPENIPLDILYEDGDLIAINKQRDLIVHPARGHWSGTMTNGLLYHIQQTDGTLSTGSDPWRPGIIHRLDRNTTGIILVAKTDEAHWRLAGQFERRTIHKTYLAVVHGHPALDSDLIDAPLGVHPVVREKYTVRKDIGRTAQTVFEVKERFKHFTLMELHPKTGRTHQLRVHLSHIGLPIVGDVTYGGRPVSLRDITGIATDSGTALIDRQALHAWKLQFVHPSKFNRMVLEAPVPADMSEFLTILRQFDR
ncbi:MAG: RluA family pseudouridine synthase [Planctomycetes bacterium]|nr:RluA family pseudouridine synthase [Planctomycetota bacterium]MDA8376823.1 RluA family pseudouridine synthase [Planctomycetia bacterium]